MPLKPIGNGRLGGNGQSPNETHDTNSNFLRLDTPLIIPGIVGGVLTIDMIFAIQKLVDAGTTGSAFSVVMANNAEATLFSMKVVTTGSVAVTFPSNFKAPVVAAWNSSTKVLTLPAGEHIIQCVQISGIYYMDFLLSVV